MESSIEPQTPTEEMIFGTKGNTKIHGRFHQPEKITITTNEKTEQIELPYQGNGYLHEIEAVNESLKHRQTENKMLPLSTSLDLISIIDRVKEQIGLRYK